MKPRSSMLLRDAWSEVSGRTYEYTGRSPFCQRPASAVEPGPSSVSLHRASLDGTAFLASSSTSVDRILPALTFEPIERFPTRERAIAPPGNVQGRPKERLAVGEDQHGPCRA